MRFTKLAGFAALVVLASIALLPVPQWAQWDDLSVGASWPCSILGLSAVGMSQDAATAGSVAPAERLDVETVLCTRPARRRILTVFLVSLVAVGSVAVIEQCIGPARSRLLTVLLVSAIGIQSVAVLEYYRNRRRRSWEIELQDQQDLFASVED